MEEKDKQRQRDRYARYLKKHGDRDARRRKPKSRSEHSGRRPRRHDWSAGDDVTFEKIAKPKAAPRPASPGEPDPGLPQATVVSVQRGRVELDNGEAARIAGHLLLDPAFGLAVGDRVACSVREGQTRVEAVLQRRTFLARSDPGDPRQELVLAANVDLAVVVAAAVDPPLRPGLIDRFLLGLSRGGVDALVCVNKLDLVDAAARDWQDKALLPYRELGIPVVEVSAATRSGFAELRKNLVGKTCVVVGHSGVGKSSILNVLDPDGGRSVGTLRADGKGRHTTSSSCLRELGDGTRVIDTPGIRAFGLDRLDTDTVRKGFSDFAPFASRCRFGDCTHRREPDCGVRDAAERGELSQARYASYLRILYSLDGS